MKSKPRNEVQALLEGSPVIPVPEAGEILGLGRSAAYAAAKKGYIPTLQLGKHRVVVPTAKLAELLGAR